MRPYLKRVLDRLRAAGEAGTTPRQIARELNTTRGAVKTALWQLRKDGYRIVRQDVLVLKKEIE